MSILCFIYIRSDIEKQFLSYKDIEVGMIIKVSILLWTSCLKIKNSQTDLLNIPHGELPQESIG